MISPGVFLFLFFEVLIFWAVRGKMAKIAQNKKLQLHLSHAISQEQCSIWSGFLVHLCKMMIPPGGCFFWAVRAVTGQKIAPNEIEQLHPSRTIYLKNSIAYDHDFWYTYVKWWYLKVVVVVAFSFFLFFFSFFEISLFRAIRGRRGRGVKGQNIAQDDKIILSIELHISGSIHHIRGAFDFG